MSSGSAHEVVVDRDAISFALAGGDPVELRTTRVSIGGATVGEAPLLSLVQGAAEIARGRAVERVDNREEGIEQSWRFEAPFSGALTVEIELRGARDVREEGDGVHFAAARGARMRYGLGTWVDANGRRWPIRPRWTRDRLLLEVPNDIVSQTTFPAVLDPTIGPELPVGDVVPVASPADERQPEIAFDGTNYLVVWEDRRLSAWVGGRAEIWAARVAPDGTVLDPNGIALTAGTDATRSTPRVAAAPTGGWLVVWQRGSATDGRRVAADGSLPDPLSFLIASDLYHPDVARIGAEYLVVGDRPASREIHGVRVGVDGIVRDATPLTLVTVPTIPGFTITLAEPRIAASSTRYLVVYEYRSSGSILGTYAAPFDAAVAPAGSPVAVCSELSSTECGAIDIASDGTNFLAQWGHYYYSGSGVYGCHARVLDGTGAGLTPEVATASTLGRIGQQVHADFGGSGYVTSCGEYGNTVVSAVSLAGGALWTRPLPSGNYRAVVGTSGADVLVPAGTVDPMGSVAGDVVAHHLDVASGSSLPGSPVRISGQAQTMTEPAVAWNGTEWLVAWSDGRPGSATDIYAARFAADGSPLDTVAIPVARAVESETLPTVASNGTDFLVAWATPGVRAVRITAAGTVRDAVPLILTTSSAIRLASASDGSGYVVAWGDSSAVVSTIHVDAATGALVPAGGQVIAGLDGFSGLDLVRGPTSYLAVGTNGTRAEGAFLDAAGTLTGSVFVVYAGAPMLYDIRASFGDTDFLAVWRSNTPDVRAARITTGGTVRDPLGIVVSTASPTFPAVSWDGTNWWTAFASFDGSPTWDTGSLFVRRISPSGAPVDTPALAIPDSGWTETRPALSAGSPRTLLVYQRYAPEYGTTRTFARLVDDLVTNGGACTSDAQCSSGHCADSVCCDTACGGSAPDCQACSVAAGAPTNGTCVLLGASRVCRPAAGACDVAEACTGSSATCPLDALRPDGSSCADAVACNGAEICMAGVCGSAGPLSCDDADLCTTDSCAEPSGCAHAAIAGCCNVAADCDDGDLCTLDVCGGPGGTCSHPTISGCCTTGAMCADASSCTADSCDGATNTCVHAAIPGCCSTGSDCSDGNSCTTDTCSAGSCSNAPIAGCCASDADCDDGNACTIDGCSGVGGTCSHAPVSSCCNVSGDCDDGNACTIDSCNVATHTCSSVTDSECCTLDVQCDDGRFCTIDSCTSGRCVRDPIADCCEVDADCEDGNACTIEACDTTSRICTRTVITDCCTEHSDCDDGMPCTRDFCSAGTCATTPIADCDAGATMPEGGSPEIDGGTPDAGGRADGGSFDAETPQADAGGMGIDGGSSPPSGGGCGCHASTREPRSFAALAGAAFLTILARRRRGAPPNKSQRSRPGLRS